MPPMAVAISAVANSLWCAYAESRLNGSTGRLAEGSAKLARQSSNRFMHEAAGLRAEALVDFHLVAACQPVGLVRQADDGH
jgi:hypothetical protein